MTSSLAGPFIEMMRATTITSDQLPVSITIFIYLYTHIKSYIVKIMHLYYCIWHFLSKCSIRGREIISVRQRVEWRSYLRWGGI
jgi:hypothetical protein